MIALIIVVGGPLTYYFVSVVPGTSAAAKADGTVHSNDATRMVTKTYMVHLPNVSHEVTTLVENQHRD